MCRVVSYAEKKGQLRSETFELKAIFPVRKTHSDCCIIASGSICGESNNGVFYTLDMCGMGAKLSGCC